MQSPFHKPVMPEQVVDFMITDLGGVYVDCTFGGGGHAELIVSQLNKEAIYVGIDQDEEALRYAKARLSQYGQVVYKQGNFRDLQKILEDCSIRKVHGILLDLGVSSYQIDRPMRGFTYMADSNLDMRMDQNSALTAEDVINEYSENDLVTLFKDYGEERKSKLIVRRLATERKNKRIKTTTQLRKIIESVVNPKFKIKSFARIFQALRIEVNQELKCLEMVLPQAIEALKTGGRILVISYHSLEDRIVKQFYKQLENPCTCPVELPECVCGKKPSLKILTRKAIRATEDEIKENSRSRSALLRVGEKL